MNPNLIISAIALLVFAVGGTYVYTHRTAPEASNTETPVTEDTGMMDVQIALLDTTSKGPGKKLGCDAVNMVTRTIPRTDAPLTAAMQLLFAEPEGEQGGEMYSFLPRTAATLQFDRAEVVDGVANIYLKGELSGLAGICDDPRADIQIKETALQFPTVSSVQIYLNSVPTDLMPARQGS